MNSFRFLASRRYRIQCFAQDIVPKLLSPIFSAVFFGEYNLNFTASRLESVRNSRFVSSFFMCLMLGEIFGKKYLRNEPCGRDCRELLCLLQGVALCFFSMVLVRFSCSATGLFQGRRECVKAFIRSFKIVNSWHSVFLITFLTFRIHLRRSS